MNAVDFPYLTKSPNEPISIANGDVRVDVAGITSSGPGSFTLEWGPTPRVVLETTQQMTFAAIERINDGSVQYQLTGDSRLGDCRLIQAEISAATSSAEELHGRFYVQGEFFIGSPAPVDELRLGIVNLDDRLGHETVHGSGSSWRGGVTIESEELRFELQSVCPTDFNSNDLVMQGGYAITHIISVKRVDGLPIPFERSERVRFAVRNWLTFIRGKRVGVPVVLGWHDGITCWESWFGIDAAPRANELPWFPNLLTSPFSLETVESLPAILTFFLKYRDDGDDFALLLAIDWYVQLFDSTRADIRIALAAFGLEQFAWWDLTLSGRLSEEGFDRLNLADSVGLCMSRASLPRDLPSQVDSIIGSRLSQSPKGPQLIAESRNAVVHPKSKNIDIHSLSAPEVHIVSEYVAQQLELLLLFALGYRGSFLDRMDGRLEKLVPWA